MSLLDVMLTIGSVTVRSLLGRRRTILMLLLAGAPILLGFLVQLGNGPRPRGLVPTLEGVMITSVLPLVALVFGTAALGSELDDGTAVHLLTKPIPRWAIVLPKVVVAGGLTGILLFPSTVVAGILIGGATPNELAVTFAFALAVLVGSFVYSTIFVALSAATSRGLVIGLGYSLLWEGLLAGALPGTQLFSVREYLRGIVSVLAPPGTLESVVGASGFVLAAVAIVVVAVLASMRLARYEMRAAD
ncbi:MAG: type transport system permease protein [Chloroflexota bacterium]|jgi:ABC-2 type transport system permease protein|nr:type transport system permease protein [Chloroflexota bacterium]